LSEIANHQVNSYVPLLTRGLYRYCTARFEKLFD